MKRMYKLIIVFVNLLFIYLFVFSSSRNAELLVQLDQKIEGYSITAEISDEEIKKIYDIADENGMAIICKNINYNGLVKSDFEYNIYNFSVIKNYVKYLGKNEIITVSPFSHLAITEIDQSYTLSSSVYVFTKNIEPLVNYFESLGVMYSISEVNEMNIFLINLIGNGFTIISFFVLVSVGILYILLTRSKELAVHFVHGKRDHEIIFFQITRILKIHLSLMIIINIIPLIYLMTLSFEYFFDYLIYIIIANLIFLLIYFIINYICVPLVIKANSLFALLKGKQILNISMVSVEIICIIMAILAIFSLYSVKNEFNSAYFFYRISTEETANDLYNLQGSGVGGIYNLSYEDNLDIASRVYSIENNMYLSENPEEYFDYKQMTLSDAFIESTDKNYLMLNSKMFNLLKIKDVYGNILINDGETAIYVPESKYKAVKQKNPNMNNIISIEDDQEVFVPIFSGIEEYYSKEAYFYVTETSVSNEGWNVYEPGLTNVFFTKEDAEYIRDKYFPNRYVCSLKQELLAQLENNWILYFNLINSAIIVLISYILSCLIYYKSLFQKYSQLLLVNIVNGNNVIPIIIKKNMLLNIVLLLVTIISFVFGNYLWLLLVIIQVLILFYEYRKLIKSDYVLEIKGDD